MQWKNAYIRFFARRVSGSVYSVLNQPSNYCWFRYARAEAQESTSTGEHITKFELSFCEKIILLYMVQVGLISTQNPLSYCIIEVLYPYASRSNIYGPCGGIIHTLSSWSASIFDTLGMEKDYYVHFLSHTEGDRRSRPWQACCANLLLHRIGAGFKWINDSCSRLRDYLHVHTSILIEDN